MRVRIRVRVRVSVRVRVPVEVVPTQPLRRPVARRHGVGVGRLVAPHLALLAALRVAYLRGDKQ